MVAGRIENEFGRLALAKLVGCIDHHRVLSLLGGKLETPRPESETAKILAESGHGPGFAPVCRDLHRADAVAAVP